MTPDLISQGGRMSLLTHSASTASAVCWAPRASVAPGLGDGALRVRGRSLRGGRGLRATCSTQERHPDNRPFDHLLGAAHRRF